MKRPRLAKKLRLMISWTLDLFLSREIEQMITVRDIEALSERFARIRARAQQPTPIPVASSPDTSAGDAR